MWYILPWSFSICQFVRRKAIGKILILIFLFFIFYFFVELQTEQKILLKTGYLKNVFCKFSEIFRVASLSSPKWLFMYF